MQNHVVTVLPENKSPKRWLTFGLTDAQEERYRNSCLPSDLAQAEICVRLFLIFLAGFLVNDYRFFRLSWPLYALTTWRLALLVYTLWLLKFMKRDTSYRSYDRVEFVWGLAVVVSAVGIAATRPGNYIGHAIVAVVLVFVSLLVVPNRFLNQLISSMVIAVGEVIVVTLVSPFLVTLAVSLNILMAYAVALATSWHIHAYRRRSFVAAENEQAAVQAQRESEAKYWQLINKAPIPLCLLDKEGVVVYVNDSFLSTFGYLREDIPTMKHWWRLAYPDASYRQWVIDRWESMVRGTAEGKTDIRPVEYRITCRDGRVRIVETFRYYLDDCFLTTFTDVTDRRLAEEALLRSEKLAAVGRMAASIAHEINNPLAAVMNTLYLAKSSLSEPDLAGQYLDMADDELKRVSHITRQTLGFYRESSAPTKVSVNSIVDSAVDVLRGKIRDKGATIKKQYDGDDFQVTAVSGELRQVFSNLLANSLDAMDQAGTVALRVSRSICVNSGQPRIRVTVADDGKGIDVATLPRIFEPLFTTKEATGSGLGLWVSKQLVDKHGGAIRVRSSTNPSRRGTVFSVMIPVSSERATQACAAGAV